MPVDQAQPAARVRVVTFNKPGAQAARAVQVQLIQAQRLVAGAVRAVAVAPMPEEKALLTVARVKQQRARMATPVRAAMAAGAQAQAVKVGSEVAAVAQRVMQAAQTGVIRCSIREARLQALQIPHR